MCGIVGIWDPNERLEIHPDDMARICDRMAERLIHRGPDDHGLWRDSSARICLAHRRLSIVDLSPTGRQPMASANGRFQITFNGEIYNWQELRVELEKLGTSFRGTSDTEVLIEAISAWGLETTVDKLVGMFAFGVWDSKESLLHLVRDRMGEKPLFYSLVRGAFVFGSELTALRALPGFVGELDPGSLRDVIEYGYVRSPRCIFRGVFKVPPASVLTVNAQLLSTSFAGARLESPLPVQRYWRLPETPNTGNAVENDDEVIAEFRDQLGASISDQLQANVPVGAFLSGGIDSSVVVAIAQSVSARPIQTFTVRFPIASHDESAWAARIAERLGTEHTVLDVDHTSIIEAAQNIATRFDEPFADPSQVPMFLISGLARQHVKVCLTGDGGDEVFAGYNRYLQFERAAGLVRRTPKHLRGLVQNVLRAAPVTYVDRLVAGVSRFSRQGGFPLQNPGSRLRKLADLYAADDQFQQYDSLLRTRVPSDLLDVPASDPAEFSCGDSGSFLIDELMRLDVDGYLVDDNLVKVDRASMAVSLECRAPLLDHRVVSSAFRLPLSQRVRGGQGKWVLRRLLGEYLEPELVERPKAGFSVPVSDWFREQLAPWIDERLSAQKLEAFGFLNGSTVRRLLSEHRDGRADHGRLIWSIAIIGEWLDQMPAADMTEPQPSLACEIALTR